MKKHLERRDFLKAVPTAAGAMAYAGIVTTQRLVSPKPADVKIGSTPYTPLQHYPIRPSQSAAVRMAHHIDFADVGRQHYDDKDFPRRVRAIRSL
jgi:hypothetical protein